MQIDPAPSAPDTALKCELASEVLRSFGTLRFAATGWSMLPTVWPGETLIVERVQPDQVRIGELVLVGREGRLCAHRVIGTEGDSQNPQWVTQGDALPLPDRPVARHELLGRVAYVVRAGRPIAVRSKLTALERLTAKIVRRSVAAARALVYLHHLVESPKESVPCQL